MAELNPQPLPPRQVKIPRELLQKFTQDLRFVRGPVAGLIMVPWEMVSQLQGIRESNLAVMIVDAAETE
jgi:hypothetical protein